MSQPTSPMVDYSMVQYTEAAPVVDYSMQYTEAVEYAQVAQMMEYTCGPPISAGSLSAPTRAPLGGLNSSMGYVTPTPSYVPAAATVPLNNYMLVPPALPLDGQVQYAQSAPTVSVGGSNLVLQ